MKKSPFIYLGYFWMTLILVVLAPLTLVAQEVTLQKQRKFPKTVPAGNYSGIAWMGGSKYAVANDKSPTTGFYLMTIDIDSISGELLWPANSRRRGCLLYASESDSFREWGERPGDFGI